MRRRVPSSDNPNYPDPTVSSTCMRAPAPSRPSGGVRSEKPRRTSGAPRASAQKGVTLRVSELSLKLSRR